MPTSLGRVHQLGRHRRAAAAEAPQRVEPGAGPAGRLGEVLQEGRRGQRVRAALPRRPAPAPRRPSHRSCSTQRQTVVERQADAVVEAGGVADRRRHPDHVAGAEAEVVVGDPDAEVGGLLGVHDRLGPGFGARGEDQLRDGVGRPGAQGRRRPGPKQRRERRRHRGPESPSTTTWCTGAPCADHLARSSPGSRSPGRRRA